MRGAVIVIVAWFVVLRGGKPVPRRCLGDLAVAVLMMVATAPLLPHAGSRPRERAWRRGVLSGQCVPLGAAAVWLISILKRTRPSRATGIQLTFIADFVRTGSTWCSFIACHGEDRAIRLRRPDIDDHGFTPYARRQPDDRHGVRRGSAHVLGLHRLVIVAAACAQLVAKKVGASRRSWSSPPSARWPPRDVSRADLPAGLPSILMY